MADGQKIRIGRTQAADFSVADDLHMSAVHFSVERSDGLSGCVLRDLNSSNGTFVNGIKVKDAVLTHGETVVAGETRFLVQTEKDEVTASTMVGTSSALSVRERLLLRLREEFQPLYAVLDAAFEPSVLKVLLESKEQYQSLYEGSEGARLAHFAPYLVHLPKDSLLLDTLVQKGWGKNWGIYLNCKKPFADIRIHLRHFLMVKLPDAKHVYFRFYDPRVLRVYLRSCTAEEARSLFGPVNSFLIEDENCSVLLEFCNQGSKSRERKLSLADTELPDTGRSYADRAKTAAPVSSTASMLTIHPQNIQKFADVARQRFEDKMLTHLQNLFPQKSGRLGESGVRQAIKHGTKRAGEYGIHRQRDVGQYLAVMFMFGPNFDTQNSSGPLYTVLRDPCLETSAARTRELCRAAFSALKLRTLRTGKKPIW